MRPHLIFFSDCFAPVSRPVSPALALFLFTSLEALPIFLEERSIYTREHSRGAYRNTSYALTNFLIYLPVCLVMSLFFTAISYFMIDLPPVGFPFQILAIFMVLLEGNAFATAVSGVVPDALTVSVSSSFFYCVWGWGGGGYSASMLFSPATCPRFPPRTVCSACDLT